MDLENNGTYLARATDEDVVGDTIIIPETVETISGYILAEVCEEIREINIPSSVKVIEEGAFSRPSIVSVTLHEGLEFIQAEVFADSSIREIDIPDSVVEIGNNAFCCCTKLRDVKLSENLEEIRPYTFNRCIDLEEIIIPGSVEIIGNAAFSNCDNLKKVTLSRGLKEIQGDAFVGCNSLREITIPKTVNRMKYDALFDCEKLRQIIAEEGISQEIINMLLDTYPECNIVVLYSNGKEKSLNRDSSIGSSSTEKPRKESVLDRIIREAQERV